MYWVSWGGEDSRKLTGQLVGEDAQVREALQIPDRFRELCHFRVFSFSILRTGFGWSKEDSRKLTRDLHTRKVEPSDLARIVQRDEPYDAAPFARFPAKGEG